MAEAPAPDYKVESLFKLYHRFPKPPDENAFSFLRKEIAGFRANASQVRGMLTLPSHFLSIAMVSQRFACEAAFEASDKRTITAEKLTDREQSIASIKLTEKWNDFHRKFAGRNLTLKQRAWRERMFRSHLSVTAGDAQQAFEALLGAAIVNAWTTFESLAGDLWEAALNHRRSLAFAALGADVKPRDSEPEKERKRKISLPFPAHLLADPNFDLNKQMGKLLREQGKWEFSRRGDLQDAYIKTFPKIKKRLQSIFSRQKLQWLGKARNSIVHNAARVDQEFVWAFKSHPTLGKLKIGDIIPFDGELVLEFVPAGIKAGTDLLISVGKFLSKGT